jgi:hypothetical protein
MQAGTLNYIMLQKNVQYGTPDDGQRNCPKHVEFYYRINLDKKGGFSRKLRKITSIHLAPSVMSGAMHPLHHKPLWLAQRTDFYLYLEHDTNSTGLKVHFSLTYFICCYTFFPVGTNVVFTTTLQFLANVNSYITFRLQSLNSLPLEDERKSEGNTTILSEIPGTTAFTRCIVSFKEN